MKDASVAALNTCNDNKLGGSRQPCAGSTADGAFAHGGSTTQVGASGPVRSAPFTLCVILYSGRVRVALLFINIRLAPRPLYSHHRRLQNNYPPDPPHASGDAGAAGANDHYIRGGGDEPRSRWGAEMCCCWSNARSHDRDGGRGWPGEFGQVLSLVGVFVCFCLCVREDRERTMNSTSNTCK